VLIAVAGCATTQEPVLHVKKDLGIIAQGDWDYQLPQALHSLLNREPSARIGIVRATVNRTDSVSYYKIIYDKQKQVLALMIRTTRSDMNDFYHLKVYDRQTRMDEFQNGLPIRGYKLYPRISQSQKKADHTIPLVYSDNPQITEWP
jgi:hypothetical protein